MKYLKQLKVIFWSDVFRLRSRRGFLNSLIFPVSKFSPPTIAFPAF